MSERRARLSLIRTAAERRGVTNPLLLAGIAENETGLAHCWSEASWACPGPASAECGGGPVIAGAGDGPCSAEAGGLGLFQFDAGSYSDTLAREGERILSVEGNVEAAVDFVLDMLVRSAHVDVRDEEEALAWMNEVRLYRPEFDAWIRTVTEYYNGCRPGRCRVYEARLENYRSATLDVLFELGAETWYGTPPACGSLPQDGATLDEGDGCFVAGGDPQYWRTHAGGFGDESLWTYTTASDTPANYALWQLRPLHAGRYRLEVYTDANWAQSRRARYRITHAGGVANVVLDQTATTGFQSLGVWPLQAQAGQVRLDDNTGEPNSSPTRLVADALRLVRVDASHRTPEEGHAMSAQEPLAPAGCAAGAQSLGGMGMAGWLALIAGRAGAMLRRRTRRPPRMPT